MAQHFDASRLSHAYIVCAASAEDALNTARSMAAAALCLDTAHAPCGSCRSCRKAFDNIHPDIITVSRLSDDKGRQKREISVEQIRLMNRDACVLPNEAERKIYIIDEADSMNISAQNAALKLLEEPPQGVVFFLCVTNADRLLPTVRSRCVELGTVGGAESGDEDAARLAAAYLKAVASGDRVQLFRWCAVGDTMDTQSASVFFETLRRMTADILCSRRKNPGLSAQSLMRLAALAERCRAYLRVNTGVKHIFGLLAVDSIAEGGK